MKKGQIYEGIIEKVNFPNKAIITVIDNHTVEKTEAKADSDIDSNIADTKKDSDSNVSISKNFESNLSGLQEQIPAEMVKVQVKGGIEGQKVRFAIKKARKDKCMGRLLEVVEASAQETQPPACPKFGICGGCTYQSLPYDKQLELKKRQVLDLIEPVYNGEEPFLYDGILASPEVYGYRNKMEFSFGDEVKDGPLTLGLHKKGSMHDILDADCCKIVHDDFTKVLCCVRDYCKEKQIPHYNKNRHEGILRHLLVRRSSSTKELLAALVVSSQKEYDWSELCAQLQNLPLEGKLIGFLLITNDSLGDVVKSDKTEILFGTDSFTEEILGLHFKISPFSFFQTNSKGAEVLYSRAREYILADSSFEQEQKSELLGKIPDRKYIDTFDKEVLNNSSFDERVDHESSVKNHFINEDSLKDKVVFDLYSGTGTIAQIIAPIAKKVIGVEIVAEAVEAAKENAAANGLTNCEFIAGDVLKVLDDISEKPDFIILDPPRDGIHPKALRKIIDYGVENIVYISCKPTSFARDLVVFQENGYAMKRMSNVDMFPQTVHVETVVLLSQQKPDDTIEIDLDLDELDATSAETKATYQEIKDYVLKEFGLKVSNLYISQVKRKCGIEVGENYNLPKTENPKVPQCPKEKEDAIKAALKYFAMI